MAAILTAAGAGANGQQPAGVVAQYQLDGINGTIEHPVGTGVSPYDSGTILSQNRPGQVGEKLVDGTVQRRSQIVADSTPGAVGNALVSTYAVGGGIPTKPAGSSAADGLSQAPQHE